MSMPCPSSARMCTHVLLLTQHANCLGRTPKPVCCQVLTYYTMWELYRNTNGAVGSTRMTKFVTQSGTSENIRVNYVVEPR